MKRLSNLTGKILLITFSSSFSRSKIEKNVNDMGEKDIEENIWTNEAERTVENQK
jgi:hypothetical protein